MAKPTAEQGYKLACYHFQTARYAQAEELCRQILRAVPGHRDALMLLSVLAHRRGSTVEGDDWLRQAFESNEYSITLSDRVDSRPRWSPHAGSLGSWQKAWLSTKKGCDRSNSICPGCINRLRSPDSVQPAMPSWGNVWMPVLDGVTLYCTVAMNRPHRYVEIGSGNSTKFVARAIADHGLDTKIISIDPEPRAEIDALCDEAVRKPLEKSNLDIFAALDENDLVFADNSHRTYMNSDVTVFLCEILPSLARGVTVGIHDIFLPYDYPEDWIGRYYSEQYLLACHLLAAQPRFDVLLPVFFAASEGLGGSLMQQVRTRNPDPLWRDGASFWLEMR